MAAAMRIEKWRSGKGMGNRMREVEATTKQRIE
jgi:hypothetical protein